MTGLEADKFTAVVRGMVYISNRRMLFKNVSCFPYKFAANGNSSAIA